MNFLELVKERHSVRHYAQQVVEKEKLDYILDCARQNGLRKLLYILLSA